MSNFTSYVLNYWNLQMVFNLRNFAVSLQNGALHSPRGRFKSFFK